MTLTDRYMQEPLLEKALPRIQEVYAGLEEKIHDGSTRKIPINHPLDYFYQVMRIKQAGVDKGVAFMQQFWEDNERIFDGALTRDFWLAQGECMPFAPGVPEGFIDLKRRYDNDQLKLYCAVITVGNLPILQQSRIAEFADMIMGSDYKYDEHGKITGYKHVVSPFSKNEELMCAMKGSTELLDQVIKHVDYKFSYWNLLGLGDGFTDVSKFSLIRQRGGICVAVYDPSNHSARDKLARAVAGRVHYVLPRDYTPGSITHQYLDKIIQGMIAQKCKFPPKLIYDLKDDIMPAEAWHPDALELTKNHYDSCGECQDRTKVIVE